MSADPSFWAPPSVSQIVAGGGQSCALISGKAYCWGSNENGELGDGTTAQRAVPVAVTTSGALSGKTILSISTNSSHTCALASDNLVYCWGLNDVGQLGDNSTTDRHVPVAVNTSGVLSGKTILDVKAGWYHTCALASDNQVYCWGNNDAGQLGNNSTTESHVPVAVNTSGVLSGKTVVSLYVADSHSCVIASDNKAYCWGSNENGQIGDNSTTNRLVPVAVNTSGVLSGKNILSLSGGDVHTCAIASDNQAYCWGYDGEGQLGDNSTTESHVPVAVYTAGVLSGKTILALDSGGYHNCVIASDNQEYCWGYNEDGQLGNNAVTQSSVPVAVNTSGVLSGKNVTALSSGDAHSCAITSDSQAYCWGDNNMSQLGDNTITDRLVPVAVLFSYPFKASNYRVYQNADSLSPGAPLASTNTAAVLTMNSQPFRLRAGVAGTTGMTKISVGFSFACGIASDNQAYCWGSNYAGQLGNNSGADSSVPVPVDTSGVLSGKTILSITAGESYACVIASDNQAYCWGNNPYGQLGNNSTTQSNVPVAVNTSGVLSGKTIRSIEASGGGAHVCAIASDNLAYCWGDATYGQLGNNSTTPSSVPVAVNTSGVLSGKTIVSISAGTSHNCVAASDGRAYCWGYNYSGQLGNNSTSQSNVPVAVSTSGVLSGKTITSIGAGAGHSCALTSEYKAYCWGNGSLGQLGNNSTSNSSVPVTVNTSGVLSGKNIVAIDGGDAHTCVLTSGSLVYCWGDNTYGQLGNNSTTQSNVAVAVNTAGVLADKAAQVISAGNYYSTCMVASGQAYCWGNNTYGLLGNNSSTQSNVAVTVVTDNLNSPSVPAGATAYKLQYAQKTAGSCSAQTGYADVTESTPIAYKTNTSVTNGANISALADDPVPTTVSSPQTYVSASGTFTNSTTIPSGKIGLWDFSLKNNAAPLDTSYCLRIAYSNGAAAENPIYPEITTASASLSVGFVDADGADLANPLIVFGGVMMNGSDSQLSTGVLGTSSQKLRVYNDLATNGWSVSIAATNGTTALWNRSDNLAKYDFNDSGGAVDGGDSDLLGGQLTVNPAGSTITPGSGCSATGLSVGGLASFSEGSTNSITLMSASNAAALSCMYDLTGVGLAQAIPAGQLPGTYTLDMTMTVVAL